MQKSIPTYPENSSINTKKNDHKFESMELVEIPCIINMIVNALNKIQNATKNFLMMFMCSNKNFSQQMVKTAFTVMFQIISYLSHVQDKISTLSL